MADPSGTAAPRPAARAAKSPRSPGKTPRSAGKTGQKTGKTGQKKRETAPNAVPPTAVPTQHGNGSATTRLSPEYLAVELGHTVDEEGEPLGLDFPVLRNDPEFRKLAVSLWRQFQASRSISKQAQELQEQGLTSADVWEPGVVEFLPTTSTPDQVRRYKQKLLFRARFLEAVLVETVAELKRLDRVRPPAEDQQSG